MQRLDHSNPRRRDPTPAPPLDLGTSGEGLPSPAFPPAVTLGEPAGDGDGPFIVYSREFCANRPRVFEVWAEAHAYAERMAKATPGFVYYIMSPCSAVLVPAHGPESAAVIQMEGGAA